MNRKSAPGLAPGDAVVTVGVDRLEEGGKVNAQIPGEKRAREAAASRRRQIGTAIGGKRHKRGKPGRKSKS